jgi:quinoprotein glucose dehydrogenase
LAAILTTFVALSLVFALIRSREKPPAIATVRAFPNLQIPLPVIFSNAGDGTNRIFVGSQLGVIHVFPNDQSVSETKIFLDIESNVKCDGEEGLLGLAFHPDYRHNGEFFVYYSAAEVSPVSIIARFRVSRNDLDKAEANSEHEIMRIKQPHGDHNGGTLVFGPDGYLYVGLGDGGNADEPKRNGQNLKTLLGSILRIDIDRKENGNNYAIPKDNPFVGRDDARPEIWAYGLRNVWRMSFDRETGRLWAGDVGQDNWEEINVIVRGGNYGWSLREGNHPFGPNGSGPRSDLIEPIWEYDHTVGRSVTGGNVYRGNRIPALRGTYLFGDYITDKAWTLRYDERSGKVVTVDSIERIEDIPVITFGEDEEGEVYLADAFGRIFGLTEVTSR